MKYDTIYLFTPYAFARLSVTVCQGANLRAGRMPGSFCILFFCNTIYVNYGSLMIYNTNHTISSKIIVKKEGDK